MSNLKKEILKTIWYFSFFNYPPSFEEVYVFLGKKATKKKVEEALKSLERQNKVKKEKDLNNVTRYTLHVTRNNTVGEYGINKSKIKKQKSKIGEYNKKYLFSQKKLQNWRFRVYVKLLSVFPQIKLVGLSGSLAMMNADEKDDIDLFIITAKDRLFTGRFLAIILAKLLKIHRGFDNKKRKKNFVIPNLPYLPAGKFRNLLNKTLKQVQGDIDENRRSTLYVTRYTNKVCLNLFFAEDDLAVPEFKRNTYVAHEVLQMKPIINKDNTYERFLRANSWVFKIFPNTKDFLNSKSQTLNPKQYQNSNIKNSKSFNFFNFLFFSLFRISCFGFRILGDWLENQFGQIEMYFINKHKTTEIITNTQLWFHPEDFYKKIQGLTQKRKTDIQDRYE